MFLERNRQQSVKLNYIRDSIDIDVVYVRRVQFVRALRYVTLRWEVSLTGITWPRAIVASKEGKRKKVPMHETSTLNIVELFNAGDIDHRGHATR